MEKLTKEKKNRQISKEVKISVVLYVCFFLWWYFTGYGFAGLSSKANTIVMGLPLWFFLSCIVGYVLFCAGQRLNQGMIGHTVRFDIGFVNQINAIFIA